MGGVEGNLEQLALGADGLEGGFAGLLEFALEPWRDSVDQFFGRVSGVDQCGRDAESERNLFDSVGAFEAERKYDGVIGSLERASIGDRVDAALVFNLTKDQAAREEPVPFCVRPVPLSQNRTTGPAM